MPLPTFLTALGIAKETTKGTGVVPADFIPVEPSSLKPLDKIMYIPDATLRGSQVDVYDEIAGPIWAEWEFGGPVYADTFGYILAGLLGDVATVGGGAPFTHTMAVYNGTDGQPKSYTLSDFYGVLGTNTRQWAGMQFAESQIKFTADGLVSHVTKATSFPSTLVARPAASYTAVGAIPAWRLALTIGGVAKTFLVDGQLTIKRGVTPIVTGRNSQNPYAIWVGACSVEGQVTFVHEDDAELTRYLTNTQPSFVVDFTQGVSAALIELKLQMSRCAYTEGIIDRSKDYVASTYKLKGIGNSTDVGASGGLSNLKAVIQSAKPSGTYA